ncbi:MAG: DUF3108 domain-containing protein [Hyphomonadaceae bacterium]
MNKFLAAAALALVALAGSATAQTNANRSFVGSYNIIARGMEAGRFNYRFEQTGASYTASASREITGWIGGLLNRSQDYTYSVRGSVTAEGRLQPSAYQHQGGRRREDRPNGRIVRSAFTANDVTTTSVPSGMGMGNPPATAAQRRGVVDQITAIAALVTASGDPCNRTINVFMDGRSRFDFVLTPNGRVQVNTGGYRGEALRCSVQFRPIAGFSDPQEASTLTFLFAPTPSGLYAPVRIEMPTDSEQIGIVRLEARQLTVNGARLQ